MNRAYENAIQRLMTATAKLALFKTKRVKGNSQEWFDGEALESIALQDKLFNTFQHSKWNVDNKIYTKAHHKLHNFAEKKEYFENILK